MFIFALVLALGLGMGAAGLGGVDHAGDPTFQCDQGNDFAWNHVCDDSSVEVTQEVESAPAVEETVEEDSYEHGNKHGDRNRGGRRGGRRGR